MTKQPTISIERGEDHNGEGTEWVRVDCDYDPDGIRRRLLKDWPWSPAPKIRRRDGVLTIDPPEGVEITAAEMARIVRAILTEPREPLTGEDVKAWRTRCGHTQSEAAGILGVEPTTISRWERGTSKPTGAAAKLLRNLLS